MKFREQFREHGAAPVVVAFLLVAFGLRLYALTLQDIWWDEARNLDVARLPLGQIATAPELDIHPPLYFWLLYGWLSIAAGQEELPPAQMAYLGRFLSVALGVLAVALLAPWGKWLDRWRLRAAPSSLGGVVGLAVMIGALSPFWLAESQETRMYSAGFALLAAAAWALLRGVRAKTGSMLRFAPYAILAAAALLVHYNAVFILAAWHFWWALWAVRGDHRRRKLLENFATGLAILVLCAPIAPIAMRQIPGYANPNLIVPSVAQYLAENMRAYVAGYAAQGEQMAGWGYLWLWTCAVLCVLGLLVLAVQRIRAGWTRGGSGVALLTTWLVGGLAFYYVAVWDRGAFNVRYASFVTPALYLLMALALVELAQARPLRLALLGLVVGGGLLAGARADLADAAFFREDVRGVVAWLEADATPDDVILVDQRYPFGFYWPGFADHPDANPQPPAGRAPARYLFVDINNLDARLNEYLRGARRVYWVRWFESDTDPRRAVPFLLDKVGTRVAARDFRGFGVTVWSLPTDAEFRLADTWQPVEMGFEGAATLVAYSAPAELTGTAYAEGQLPVVLRWAAIEPRQDRRWKARVALYDAAGARLAQIDTRLLNDRHLLPGEWARDDRPLNVYMLDFDQPPAPGIYELRVLVYDEDSQSTIAWPHVTDPAQAIDGVELILGQISVPAAGQPN